MTGYVVVALAALMAVVIRADARRRDPYFAYYELVPGTAISRAFAIGEPAARRAVISRFGYPLVFGILVGAVVSRDPWDAIIGGVLVAGFLLWPMTATGLPRGHLQHDALIVAVYGAVLVLYGVASLLGQQFVVVVAGGDILTYARRRGSFSSH